MTLMQKAVFPLMHLLPKKHSRPKGRGEMRRKGEQKESLSSHPLAGHLPTCCLPQQLTGGQLSETGSQKFFSNLDTEPKPEKQLGTVLSCTEGKHYEQLKVIFWTRELETSAASQQSSLLLLS